MRKIAYLMVALVAMAAVAACNDEETYADQVKTERQAVSKYLADSAVTVISEDQFKAAGYKTDLRRNEFVLFSSTGVYMQIVRQGAGQPLRHGESTKLLCRYIERNLLTDTITATNMLWSSFGNVPDEVSVTDESGSFTAMFVSGHSSLMSIYGSSSTEVPKGWLVPLSYVNLGRQTSPTTEQARVRIIVPHEMGTSSATQTVTPCLYDIIYTRER